MAHNTAALPKVSVIITSYNHERYIRECINSVLKQTFTDFEAIVVDDASKDASIEILKSYGNQIRLIVNNPNVGTYVALNIGLEAAKGEYVALLNSDDVWLPTKLQRQVELLDAYPEATFCHTYGRFIAADGGTIQGRPMGFPFPRTPAPTADCFPIFIANNSAIASSVLMRAAAARSVTGFDPTFKNLGDWDMWLRLSEQGPVGYVDEELTLYRIHGQNTIYQIETTRAEEMRIRQRLRERVPELLAKAGNVNALKHALAHTIACLGSLYSILGNPQEARRCYQESLRLYPGRVKTMLRYALTYAPLSIRRRLI